MGLWMAGSEAGHGEKGKHDGASSWNAAMIIFPAIDLKDGVCVRLKKGVMADATVFNTDPAAQAKSFAAQGFRWLHCVDLNGAFAGKSANSDAIRAIRAAIDLPIQLGGGIRDLAAVEG